MKLREIYKKYDDLLLRKKPVLWVLGLHIYLPLLLTLYAILFLIGLVYPFNPVPFWKDYEELYNTISLVMILPTILLAIMFIIRQIKFNSRRIHVQLPYRRSFGNMIYFFVLFGLIIALPFVGSIGATLKTKASLDIEEFKEDMVYLSIGGAHFRLEKYRVYDSLEWALRKQASMEYEESVEPAAIVDDSTTVESIDEESVLEEAVETEAYSYYDKSAYTYELNDTKDSLIFYREIWNLKYYYSYNELDTISIDSAKREMKKFIAVSSKYQGGLTLTDVDEIFTHNLNSNRTYTRSDSIVTPAFNHFLDHANYINNTRFHREYVDNSGPFFIKNSEFWLYYMLIALGLSILLLILCSVKIIDFGWAMLVAALMPTIFGILFAITLYISGSFHDDDEIIATILLILFTLSTVYIGFFSKLKPTLKRAFAIAFHCYIPILVAIFLNLIRDLRDCCNREYDYDRNCDCYEVLNYSQWSDFVLAASVLVILVATYFYGKYYRKQYVNPQNR